MSKILVTGAAGFIGFYLCKALLEKGYKVVGLDNINDYYAVQLKYDRLKELGIEQEQAAVWKQEASSALYASFSFVRMNLEDREGISQLFQKEQFKLVVNLAAQAGVRYSIENPAAYIDSNIVGFLNILEGCRYNAIEHLVYASSSSVYGENEKVPFHEGDQVDIPVSLYAATKKANELMAHTYSHLYKIPTTGLRFFTVYGPWGRPDMAPMLFAGAITSGKPINIFNEGKMSRDFTFIEDIVNGIIIAMDNPNKVATVPYQVFNIGNGSPVNLLDFISTLEEALGVEAVKQLLPMQPGDVPRTWADLTALQQLGYKSNTAVKEGIEAFVEWYKRYFKV